MGRTPPNEPTPGARIFGTIVVGLLILGGCTLALSRTTSQLWIAIIEREPTTVDLDNFASSYKGEKWLRVHGRVLPELTIAKKRREKASRSEVMTVAAAMVGPNWKDGDPIHLMVSIGTFSAMDGRSEALQHVGGNGLNWHSVIVDPSMDDYDRPDNLVAGEPLLWAHNRDRPDSLLVSMSFSLLCLGLIAATLWHFWKLPESFRALKAARESEAEQVAKP